MTVKHGRPCARCSGPFRSQADGLQDTQRRPCSALVFELAAAPSNGGSARVGRLTSRRVRPGVRLRCCPPVGSRCVVCRRRLHCVGRRVVIGFLLATRRAMLVLTSGLGAPQATLKMRGCNDDEGPGTPVPSSRSNVNPRRRLSAGSPLVHRAVLDVVVHPDVRVEVHGSEQQEHDAADDPGPHSPLEQLRAVGEQGNREEQRTDGHDAP